VECGVKLCTQCHTQRVSELPHEIHAPRREYMGLCLVPLILSPLTGVVLLVFS
jgi:hypothetical protein